MSRHGHGLCSDRTSDVCVPMDTTFSEMHLINEKIRKGLKEANFIVPAPVQRKALPRTLCGFDTIFKSKSGTGKTAVFAITALQSIIDLESNQAQVLILAPTREIAVQIVDVISTIGAFVKDLKADWFIGGTAVESDVEKLKRCRIVVGAPGRIAHLIELGHLNTKSIRLFVVDEADEMIQPIFQKDFNFIFNSLPENKQVLICSATFTFEIIKFLRKYMSTFCFISGDEEDNTEEEKLSFASLVGMKPFVSVIEQKYSYNKIVLFSKKLTRLQEILKTTTFSQCLIFTNYKTRVKTIINNLCGAEFIAAFLCSEQTQTERLQALEDLKQGKCRILVTTDLAARGIDVQNVDTVINFEVPINERTYLHRMGRAGRYGSNGVMITISAEGDEMVSLRTILTSIKASVFILPSQPPFNAADFLKGKHSKLDEISGTVKKVESSHLSSLSFSENTADNWYVLGKDYLTKEFGCEIEDMNLKHFKDDIERNLEKFKALKNCPKSFEEYFSICRLVKNFHPELLSYVEKMVANLAERKSSQTDEIKSGLSTCDSKENICPTSTGCGGSSLNGVELLAQSQTNGARKNKAANKMPPNLLAKNTESSDCHRNGLATFGTLSRKFLKRLYCADWAEDISLEKFKCKISQHHLSLLRTSSHFSSELETRLKNMNPSCDILSSCLASDSVKNKSMENYYCLCKRFKSMDKYNLVDFVEKKLEEQKIDFLAKVDAFNQNVPCKIENGGTESESSFINSWRTGVPLALNLIKRKPDQAKSIDLKNLDANKTRLGSKYLYLSQNLLKRLYNAPKISKDFCVEHARSSIEPSFTQLWKSNLLSTSVMNSLYRKDILKRPTKLLTNKNLELYYQFCRHFKYLNPQLVSIVESKVNKIEAGTFSNDPKNRAPEEDDSKTENILKNTGRIPAEVLAFYYQAPQISSDLEIDESVKEKVIKRFASQTAITLDLKNKSKVGKNLLVEPSFSGNFFQSYFRLCKLFPKFDAGFINHVDSKLKESFNIKIAQGNPQIVSASPKLVNISADGSASSILSREVQDQLVNIGTSCKKDVSIGNEGQNISFKSSSASSVEGSSKIQSSEDPLNTNEDGLHPFNATMSMSYKELSTYPPCQLSSEPSSHLTNELSTELSNYLSCLLKMAKTGRVLLCPKNQDLVPVILQLLENKKVLDLKDIERFTRIDVSNNSNLDLKGAPSFSNETKMEHSAVNTSNLTYKSLLPSLQNANSEVSESINSPVMKVLALDNNAKDELESFLTVVSTQAEKWVSFKELNTTDAVKLLYNDDQAILQTLTKEVKSSSVTPPNEIFSSNESNEPKDIGIANLSPEKLRAVLENLPDSSESGYQLKAPPKLLIEKEETHKKVETSEDINIGISNLSPEKLRVILEKLPNQNDSDNQFTALKSLHSNIAQKQKLDQKEKRAEKVQASLVKGVNKWLQSSQSPKGETSKNEDDDSPEWLTVSSSTDESDDEDQFVSRVDDPSSLRRIHVSTFVSSSSEGKQSNTMNLCDRCKNWYASTEKSNVEAANKNTLKTERPKKSKRVSKKYSSVNIARSSSHLQNQVPSYEDLIQWYNTWHQQVIFSQQFVWYNEYMQSMSSHK